jgi:hypothetical protein
MVQGQDDNSPRMRFEIEIDAASRLIVWRIHGRFRLSEIKAAYADLLTHPDWNETYDQLTIVEQDTDMSNVTFDSLQSFSERMETAQNETRPDTSNRSAIVFRQAQQYALLKSFEFGFAGRGKVEQRVFGSESQARRWLARQGN